MPPTIDPLSALTAQVANLTLELAAIKKDLQDQRSLNKKISDELRKDNPLFPHTGPMIGGAPTTPPRHGPARPVRPAGTVINRGATPRRPQPPPRGGG